MQTSAITKTETGYISLPCILSSDAALHSGTRCSRDCTRVPPDGPCVVPLATATADALLASCGPSADWHFTRAPLSLPLIKHTCSEVVRAAGSYGSRGNPALVV